MRDRGRARDFPSFGQDCTMWSVPRRVRARARRAVHTFYADIERHPSGVPSPRLSAAVCSLPPPPPRPDRPPAFRREAAARAAPIRRTASFGRGKGAEAAEAVRPPPTTHRRGTTLVVGPGLAHGRGSDTHHAGDGLGRLHGRQESRRGQTSCGIAADSSLTTPLGDPVEISRSVSVSDLFSPRRTKESALWRGRGFGEVESGTCG